MKSIGWRLLLFSLLTISWSKVNAQLEFPEDKVSWKFKIEQNGCEATLIAEISIVNHWHIYAAKLPEGTFLLPTEIKLKKSPNFSTVGGIIEPKPIFEHDEMADEDLYYHSGKIIMKRKLKITSEKDFTLSGTFAFQTCDDKHCLPPHSADFTVKVKGCGSETTTKVEDEMIPDDQFAEINGDEAKGKDGKMYVQFNGGWVKVPAGNSVQFYKKYLELGGKHEE